MAREFKDPETGMSITNGHLMITDMFVAYSLSYLDILFSALFEAVQTLVCRGYLRMNEIFFS